MKRGFLSSYFSGVAAKYLSAVEADMARSHQHELNGVAQFRQILGLSRTEFEARFIYLTDDEDKTLTSSGTATWYDARENVPTRSAEYRLYLSDNDVYEMAEEGDLLLVALTKDRATLCVVIARAGSTAARQTLWLFGLLDDLAADFTVTRIEGDGDVALRFPATTILEYLGLEAEETDDTYLETMIRRFDERFPKTADFSRYARSTLPDLSARDPDAALIQCMEQEEILFRTLEKHLVWKTLETHFADVDEFMEFSLSVQNRRKSRAGYALENHIQWLLDERKINYSRNKITEGTSRPDFLFPGVTQYHDSAFPEGRLSMLGVKSTCKDRWRQVLAEAARIPRKHLLTLEPGISENQTSEMSSHGLTLVVPLSIQDSYIEAQRARILSMEGFLELIGSRQGDWTGSDGKRDTRVCGSGAGV